MTANIIAHMSFFDIKNVALQLGNYSLSYVELIGALFGLISVILATRSNVLTWPTGIVNEALLFILFFQVRLYADMTLQIYFFITTIYGWYNWRNNPLAYHISKLSRKCNSLLFLIFISFSILFGAFFQKIHLYLPEIFEEKAAYPFVDSLVLMGSALATILLAKRKIENWYYWIATDIICVIIYIKKEIYFLSAEYLIFLLLASYGLFFWKKKLSNA
jgi:nicotinamide mononucleotide transporter